MSSADATNSDLGAEIDRIETNSDRHRTIADRDVALGCLRVTVDHLHERVAELEAEKRAAAREGQR